jgi:outer membrane protein TolC
MWRVLGACVLAWAAASCAPVDYRKDADRIAGQNIKVAQQKALGKTPPFTIETPADTLRRRLMLGQDLPYSSPASVNVADVKLIAHWPEKQYPYVPPTDQPPVPPWMGEAPLKLSLFDTLEIAARNNRDYQTNKENIFTAALSLDLQQDQFRNIFTSTIEGDYSADLSGDEPVQATAVGGGLGWSRMFKNGTQMTAQLALGLANLLTQDRASSFGILGDATISVPLLRGSAEYVVTEPLTQAERNVVYSIRTFERFKQALAVQVASGYLGVLQQQDAVDNAAENYRQLIGSRRRARRLADAGRLPEIQVDQALQDELRARDRWITAQQTYSGQLDNFKITLGLPTDARIELDRSELQRLRDEATARLEQLATTQPSEATTQPAQAAATTQAAEVAAATQPSEAAAAAEAAAAITEAESQQIEPLEVPAAEKEAIAALKKTEQVEEEAVTVVEPTTQPAPTAIGAAAPIELVAATREGGGPLEMDPTDAVILALEHRLDLRTAQGRVYDAQRDVVVAADALQAELTLFGEAKAGGQRGLGSAEQPDAQLRFEKGVYSTNATLDLPLHRTAERDAYRQSFINLDQAVRNVQLLEDSIKLQVRGDLRDLLQARESYKIQSQAVQLAERRVVSTQLFLEAGRAEIRDLLDAQEALVSAQNALTAALVNYRVSELQLQRDMDLLDVDEKGLWHEYQPKQQ